jgi:predicted nuclease of restriction endonuclease-like (RecB) superfamily
VIILGQCKRPEEREFYLRLAIRERWSSRELERQLKGALFERTVLSPPQVSLSVSRSHTEALAVFKDAYLVEFLDLPRDHAERDLHRGLLLKLKDFLGELGRDFCFVGTEFPVQVGGRDFALDLLFFHRGLNCLVAIELKVGRFEPEYLGKLGFYLVALDRDVRKPHEQPAIGVPLCASKDEEVVEYALSRTLSPALIAEYRTQLPTRSCCRPSCTNSTARMRRTETARKHRPAQGEEGNQEENHSPICLDARSFMISIEPPPMPQCGAPCFRPITRANLAPRLCGPSA